MTLEEAVFKSDLGFAIFTEYTETCRSACFRGLWMFHDSYGELTDFFKEVLFSVAYQISSSPSLQRTQCQALTQVVTLRHSLPLRNSHCPRFSVTFFSILNLNVASTHHSRLKCTCLWNTFLIIPFMCDSYFALQRHLSMAYTKGHFIFHFQTCLPHSKQHEGKRLCLYFYIPCAKSSGCLSVCYRNGMFNWRMGLYIKNK